MEILIVDDIVTIVNGLEKGIQWEAIGVSKVWKAHNAIEAKQIIINKKIDILLCDIEMPEENGLSLCQWIKEKGYDMEIIFLTAHADFEYAKEAVKLGAFEYVLQPIRYDKISDVLHKVIMRINDQRREKKYVGLGEEFYFKKQLILDDIFKSWIREKNIGDEEVAEKLGKYGYSIAEDQKVYCALIQILRWNDDEKRINKELLCFSTENIIQELLEEYSVSVFCFNLDADLLSCIITGDSMAQMQDIRQQFSRYIEEMCKIFSCEVAIYYDAPVSFKDVPRSINYINEINSDKDQRESKVYYVLAEEIDENSNRNYVKRDNDEVDLYVEKSVYYIQHNIEQSIKITDLARYIGLNEDYLTRIFKRKKGISLKEYVINEKMKVAKDLLIRTNLPIGLIASKVGYDSFSHFSASYRRKYGITPMTERELRSKS